MTSLPTATSVGNLRDLHAAMHERRREMQRVADELDDIAGHLNAQHGRLIDVAVWLLAHPAQWSGDGVWKPEQYLAWRCGIGLPTAAKIVGIARRADQLPDTVAALRAGELSVDQATPIAKGVPGWAEARVVGLAKRLTVRQIQRTVSQYPFGDDPSTAGVAPDDAASSCESAVTGSTADGEATPDAPTTGDRPTAPDAADGRCWYGTGDDGRWRLFVETTRDVGDVIALALDEARDALFHRDGQSVAGIHALMEVAQRSLDAVESPARRERHRVNIHLRIDGTTTDERGNPLPDSIRRHLTCDGIVSPIFVENGLPVSVGRSERIVPERTRRVVLLRDGGCRVPGCSAEHHLDIHHIVHWRDHGPSDTWNLIALCPRHHRLHHQGRLGIAGNADQSDGVTFRHADGRPIRPSGASPNPPSGPPPPIDGTYAHPIGERLDTWYVDFHPPPTRQRPAVG